MVKGPGLYSDIGKKARDLLYKDYQADHKVTITTYSPTGVAITSSGTKKGDLFLADVNTQLKRNNITTDIKVDTYSNLSTTITIDEPVPGLKTILSFKIPDQRSGKVELQYLHDYAGICASVGVDANPIVNFSGVVGTNISSLGADVSFDTKTGNFTKYNAGLSSSALFYLKNLPTKPNTYNPQFLFFTAMTEVLHSPSSSSSSSLQTHDTTLFVNQDLPEGVSRVTDDDVLDRNDDVKNRGNRDTHQLSLLALLLALFRKSFLGPNSSKNTVAEERLDLSGMEIGWPTDVRHVAHVTFDRFNGFLGLPVEFEPEVPRRAPSASATVFGVSTESMQLSYDSRGNSVPVILILMQQRLYSLGGLQAEGIFRINADNSQEEHLRNQLNSGVVPDGIDVHCLAGLIKAWFRELPTGVLDPLPPEQVIQCQSEDDCTALCRLLPPTETALLDWAINLMADVVQHEHVNKMNSHNIAMVFAPNMTQMADPLTALMYAVQVMNFLKTLITKSLREREDLVIESSHGPPQEPPSDDNGDQGPRLSPHVQQNHDENEEKEHEFITDDDHLGYLTASEESDGPGSGSSNWSSQSPPIEPKTHVVVQSGDTDKTRTLVSNLSSINSQTEKIEAWR